MAAGAHPQPEQAIPYEILPADEMPHLVNPSAGWFVNANNDPAGTVLDNDPLNPLRPGGGLYYLDAYYDFGLRAGRITELIRAKVASGARVIPRHAGDPGRRRAAGCTVLRAPDHAGARARRGVQRAAAQGACQPAGRAGRSGSARGRGTSNRRLVSRRATTPPTATACSPHRPSQEIAESVAATLYNVWRGQFIRTTVDATLDGVPLPPGTLPKPGSQLVMTALKSLLERHNRALAPRASTSSTCLPWPRRRTGATS